ncbi:hypothetical protein Angca_001974, partial [Angiostrongylus cantonensis]
MFVGFLLRVLDIILELSLSRLNSILGCVVVECFLTTRFLYYWGISNMVMGILIIVLSTLIFAKFRAIQQKPQPASVLMSREKKFRQANRNCAGVLFISLVFVTFRSVFVGVTAIMGACTPLRVAVIIGPFYILGLICAG